MWYCQYQGEFHLVTIDSHTSTVQNSHRVLIVSSLTVTVANILDDTFKVTIDEELLEVGLTEEELLEAKMEVEVK